MPSFIVTLRNEKEKLYQRFANLIFILNAGLITFSQLSQKLSNSQRSVGITTLILIFTALFIAVAKSKHSRREYLTLLSYFSSVIYWAYLGYWWISLIMVALVMLYYIAARWLRVVVTAEEVIYPTWPEKKLKWAELNNIILKDNLLTIDFKNNKIFQQFIDEKTSQVNEEEFNEFCRQQLNQPRLGTN